MLYASLAFNHHSNMLVAGYVCFRHPGKQCLAKPRITIYLLLCQDKDVWWLRKRKQSSVYLVRVFFTHVEMMLSAQTSMGCVLVSRLVNTGFLF